MDISEKIKVMQAYIDGSDIESRDKLGLMWAWVDAPCWNWDANEYRIKKYLPIVGRRYKCGNSIRRILAIDDGDLIYKVEGVRDVLHFRWDQVSSSARSLFNKDRLMSTDPFNKSIKY